MMSWFGLRTPVLDTDQMCEEIAQRTGISLEIVNQIIDAETDYLVKVKIIKNK